MNGLNMNTSWIKYEYILTWINIYSYLIHECIFIFNPFMRMNIYQTAYTQKTILFDTHEMRL